MSNFSTVQFLSVFVVVSVKWTPGSGQLVMMRAKKMSWGVRGGGETRVAIVRGEWNPMFMQIIIDLCWLWHFQRKRWGLSFLTALESWIPPGSLWRNQNQSRQLQASKWAETLQRASFAGQSGFVVRFKATWQVWGMTIPSRSLARVCLPLLSLIPKAISCLGLSRIRKYNFQASLTQTRLTTYKNWARIWIYPISIVLYTAYTYMHIIYRRVNMHMQLCLCINSWIQMLVGQWVSTIYSYTNAQYMHLCIVLHGSTIYVGHVTRDCISV